MCGIVGYVGSRPGLNIAVEALRRMEYRGYDSSGVAVADGHGQIHAVKAAGKLANLEAKIAEVRAESSSSSSSSSSSATASLSSSAAASAASSSSSVTDLSTVGASSAAAGEDAFAGSTAIGHTRWATHGRPNDRNAHPHRSFDGKVAIVHNGIIENFASLRAELEERGIELLSETDSEVAAHHLALAYNEGETAGDFRESALAVVRKLEGAFTLLFMHADHPDMIIAARRSTPLIVGVGKQEMFLGSDVAAFIEYTKDAVELGQDSVVIITKDAYELLDFDGAPAQGRPFTIDWDLAAAEKGGYDSFMMKEIHEQPDAIRDTLAGHFVGGRVILDEQGLTDNDLKNLDKVYVVACGSAYHSGLLAKYAIEHWVRLPVEIEVASEFRYRDPILDKRTLVIAVSQSGETADTLEAVRHAKAQGAKVLAVCNTNGSQIPRESDAVLYTHAGPEIGVASTKAFLAQVAANYIVGLTLAQARGTKYPEEIAEIWAGLEKIPAQITEVLNTQDQVDDIATTLGKIKTMLFLGRGVGYPVALEGALKLKELAYIHAEGFPAGELKHGPIALIEDDLPVVVIVPSPNGVPTLHSKIVSNIQEIRARGAKTIVIAEEGDEAVKPFANWLIELPHTSSILQPLLATVPLQYLSAFIARECGNEDIDKPRNLAKSVTVE